MLCRQKSDRFVRARLAGKNREIKKGKSKSMPKTLIIDGNSILNRAFYGVRPMTTRDGRPTNALYGFVNMIAKQLESLSPDAAGIAFDLRAPTFRHKACDFYKATRKGMPEELHAQLEPAKEAARLMGLHVLSLEGYEADDILGTAAKHASDEGNDCYLLTGDRDSFQLVDDRVFVLLCTTGETVLYDKQKIAETYGGLSPRDLIDVKALMGDTSDNIPGVAGIGEKTAVKLISEFSSLDALYASYESSSLSAGVKAKLAAGKESAYQSRFLAEIVRDVPLPLSFSDLRYDGMRKGEFYTFLNSFELKSLIKRLSLEGAAAPSLFDGDGAGESAGEEKNSAPAVEKLPYEKAPALPEISPHTAVFADFSAELLAVDNGFLYVLPLRDEFLRAIFENPSHELTVYDAKELSHVLSARGISFAASYFDVMLADYVASPAAKGDAESFLSGHDTTGFDLSDPCERALCTAHILRAEQAALKEKLQKDDLEFVCYDIEFPLSRVLFAMERRGFRLDVDGLRDYGKILEERRSVRMNNIFALSGKEFNIQSPKQLGEVLFDTLSLPALKKTKSGYSTDAETLEKLRPYHPIINEILDFRTVAKLNSTYVEGLLKVCDLETHRVHTTFKQALTLTGRLSSIEPNLQNIPIRQPEGRELRKYFTAKDGCVLIDADYSQIELRILAALSGDETMCRTFREGVDIHTMTASQVFGVPTEEVTPEMRKNAKAVNFGIVYGISDFSLAGDIGVTKKQAADYIERYFARYPRVREYLDSLIAFAEQNGYVKTYFGRRRYIPELTAKNKVMQAFGKRVAMNSPIQGTAADIIKIAMIRTENALAKAGLAAKLILQVHDELIVECPEEEKDRAAEILRREMENCVNGFAVPLEVSLAAGKTWFSAHA